MKNATELQYQSGFGNEFSTEAMAGALPKKGNTPQQPPHGLYAEQISGTAFTVAQKENKRTWLYRIRPSVLPVPFKSYKQPTFLTPPFAKASPEPLRWDALPFPKKSVDMIDGIVTVTGGGEYDEWAGLCVHRYAVTASMKDKYFYNADGEMLFVPEQGKLIFRTEMGVLHVEPGEICAIPRGVKFAVDLIDGNARGYICENFGAPFTLPDLGPLGANALAYPRHFMHPVAAYEDKDTPCTLVAKFDGALWSAGLEHSPLDVVAWHGNYAPYKYNLDNFAVVNAVSFDHSDPSIFTVLTSPSPTAGVANIDFVIFPPRWMVAEDTFRPPYFHRNVMSEFMGLIKGVYDAKESGGFVAGGCSLHNCMTAHGPEAAVVEKSSKGELKPVKLKNTMAFMFESRFVMRPAPHALTKGLQKDYYKCWQGLKKRFA